MVQSVIGPRDKEPEPEKGERAIGNIVLEMRKDLLGKTELQHKILAIQMLLNKRICRQRTKSVRFY